MEPSCPHWAAIQRSGCALGGSPPSFNATSVGGRPGEVPAPRDGVLASDSLTCLPIPPVHPGLTASSQLLCSSLGTLLPPPAQAILWGGSDCRVTAGLQGSPCSRLPGVPRTGLPGVSCSVLRGPHAQQLLQLLSMELAASAQRKQAPTNLEHQEIHHKSLTSRWAPRLLMGLKAKQGDGELL